VRSGGTAKSARRKVTVEDLRWADVVLVMEEKHASRLRSELGRALDQKPIAVLDVPDDYRFMDPELVALLEESVSAALGVSLATRSKRRSPRAHALSEEDDEEARLEEARPPLGRKSADRQGRR